MIDPADRQRLASELHALRVEAGLSTTELASRTGWSQSKVSRLELGRTLAKPAEVTSWLAVTGADSARRAALLEIAEQSAEEVTIWRRAMAPGRRRVQEEIQRLESEASVTRVFAPGIVVGLAQNRKYAEAVFHLGHPVVPDEELAGVVAARLSRQHVLDDDTKNFHLLMGEAALRRMLVTPAAMRDQIARLIELSSFPNVVVGVIPFGGPEVVHQYHGFEIIGDPELDDEAIVVASTVTRAINIRSPDEVSQYLAHFAALQAAALEGDALRRFLREVIADLPTE